MPNRAICFWTSVFAATAFLGFDALAAKSNINSHLQQAAKFSKAGDFDKALQECDLVQREDPKNIVAFKQRIAVFYLSKKYNKALRECTQAIESSKNNPDFLLARALLLGMLNDVDSAMKDFNDCIKANPNLPEAYFFRGNFELLQGHRVNAIRDYDLTISKNKTHPAVYLARYFKARAEDMEGRVDAALRDYSESIKLDPGKLPPLITNDPLYSQCMPKLVTESRLGLIERAQLLAQTGRYKESVEDFDQLMSTSCKDAVLFMSRGSSLYMSGQPDKAIADFNHAIQLSPHLTDPTLNRGFALLSKRQYDKAAFDFENWMVNTYWHDDEAPRVAALCNVSYLMAKQPTKAKHVLDKTLSKNDGAEWPTPILKFAAGNLSAEALLKAATDSTKQTQARTLLGLKMLADGKAKEAGEYFAWVKKSGDKKTLEFPVACSFAEPAKQSLK